MALGLAYGGGVVPEATIDAAGDLSTYRSRFMTINGDGELELTTFANGPAEGVLLNLPSAQGQPATMQHGGVVRVEAGDVVTHGAKVALDNTGRAIVAGSGAHVLGTAIDAAAQAGDFIDILLVSQDILA